MRNTVGRERRRYILRFVKYRAGVATEPNMGEARVVTELPCFEIFEGPRAGVASVLRDGAKRLVTER